MYDSASVRKAPRGASRMGNVAAGAARSRSAAAGQDSRKRDGPEQAKCDSDYSGRGRPVRSADISGMTHETLPSGWPGVETTAISSPVSFGQGSQQQKASLRAECASVVSASLFHRARWPARIPFRRQNVDCWRFGRQFIDALDGGGGRRENESRKPPSRQEPLGQTDEGPLRRHEMLPPRRHIRRTASPPQ